ncbi:MFS transporter [Methylobacterium sp.]|jgi:ACS family glucarate transporter-like MFS transporter|uniref:MFS transporter n=1 Tax=Methylobacterium sp. TaxID=409 RepID=UPI0025D0007C|nr:MFS transporter [Methylobacterium sp.]MBY0260210.1 MFS transporter [Methylobacterium sp.]
MALALTLEARAQGRVRWGILLMLFVTTVVNYADRAIISIAGTPMSQELGLTPVTLGYILSAFSWSYVAAQVPGGWMLDRYGSKWVYAGGIFFWSLFTLAQGWVGFLGGGAVVALFILRFLVGIAEAPSFPGNARIVTAWFPSAERGKASAIFNSAQYFAPVLFAPLTAWVTHEFGWRYAFIVMGVIGIVLAAIWIRVIHDPADHPTVTRAELDHIASGGALLALDAQKHAQTKGFDWGVVRQLLSNRMLVGIYVAQHCINVMTYFFLTWFPIYLVKQRGLTVLQAGFVASLPALCGFLGGILGGVISDAILKRTGSLTKARKIPIVAGMLLSMSIIACNYVDSPAFVIGFMALAFFGKGIGALGWAVISDTSPKEAAGLSGAIFNMFGNTAGITTPIVIGYLVQASGSFNGALVFVGCNALIAMIAYLVIVGEIRRVELRKA